ncbi:hypothetical protein AMTRI_Chr01g137300 [Amborella trichopoda]
MKVVEEAIDAAELEWPTLPRPQRMRSRLKKEADLSFDPFTAGSSGSIRGGKDIMKVLHKLQINKISLPSPHASLVRRFWGFPSVVKGSLLSLLIFCRPFCNL